MAEEIVKRNLVVVRCPECGREWPGEFTYCPECSAELKGA